MLQGTMKEVKLNEFWKEYNEKLVTAEEAVKVVKSGDWVDYGCHLSFPEILDRALAGRKDELQDVKVRSLLMYNPLEIVECDPKQEHFVYHSWHMSKLERQLCDKGQCYFIPMLFRNLPGYYRRFLDVNVAMMAVPPMDDNGYFNFSVNNATARAVMDKADVIILEINERLPRLYGVENQVHISEVDYIVEGSHRELNELPSANGSEIDEIIADLIVSRMEDGACIQLGVGGMPDLIGKKIADSDLKNLGIHSELIVNANLDMYKAGKITNLNKPGDMKGKSIGGLVYGTKELVDWSAENPDVLMYPMNYVNSVDVVRSIDKFTSINSCVAVDLYGQISSESAGTRHISGTGGQLDFLTGAYDNPTSSSYICMPSSRVDKKGIRHSNVRATFNGDIITDPRSQAYMIATEYGIVNLAGRSTWERAELLISIAHPDFRDELIREAEKMKIWRRTNRL